MFVSVLRSRGLQTSLFWWRKEGPGEPRLCREVPWVCQLSYDRRCCGVMFGRGHGCACRVWRYTTHSQACDRAVGSCPIKAVERSQSSSICAWGSLCGDDFWIDSCWGRISHVDLARKQVCLWYLCLLTWSQIIFLFLTVEILIRPAVVHKKGREVCLGRLCKTSGDAVSRSWSAPSLWKSPQGSTFWGTLGVKREKLNMSQNGKGEVKNILQHSFKSSRVLLFHDFVFEPNTGQRAPWTLVKGQRETAP